MDPQRSKLPPVTIILAVGIVVVIILILFTSYFQLNQKKQEAQRALTPTPIVDARGRVLSPTPNPYQAPSKKRIEQNKAEEPELKQQQVLTPQERQIIFAVAKEMPVTTEDYEIGYSDYLNKFYVYRKTTAAQAAVAEYFNSKNLTTILNDFPILIQYVSEPVQDAIRKAEDELRERRLSAKLMNVQGVATVNAQAQTPPADTSDPRLPDQNDTKPFTHFFIDLLRGVPDESDTDTTTIQPGGGGAGGGGGTGAGNIPATGDLAKIINEAANKIGTPAKIIQAIMRHECGRLLDPGFTSDAQIAQWSTPGQGLPPDHYCFENDGGDQGPMQFNKFAGSFTSYGSAVNEYGGYTHEPYVENIRDAVYAAALKLRAESDEAPPFGTWTEAQVKHAVICYNAGCGALGNPPSSSVEYANEVWQEYSSP